ncbi:MAG: thioredoxin domain-containing protein [Bacillota bacterium]
MILVKKYSQEDCGPCKMVSAYLQSEKEFIEKENVTIEDIDVAKDLTKEERDALPYQSVPFLLFYRNGVLMTKSRGMSIPDEFRDCVKIAKEAR